MKLENLIEALPEFDGVEASTLSSIANEVANAGYMPSSSSAEEHISPTAAANLLIAMNTPYMPESPAVSVPIFRGLKKWNDPNYYGLPHHRAFRNMSMAETFGDAIEALLQDACRIRQWFLEGVWAEDVVNYIMSDICPPLRVTFTTGALPDATITVNRAEGDPIYWLEFVSTSETVKPMPVDDRPQDRVTEISVGLPTLLNIAGAVLGRDLIEEEVEDDRRYADQIAALLRGNIV